MATTLSITTTYAGEFAGKYIAAALLTGNTLGSNAISISPNVKAKTTIKTLALASIMADEACDFSDTGSVTLAERDLSPKKLKVNLELCKTSFVADWEAVQMGYSAWNKLPPNFESFFLAYVAEMVAQETEQNLWHGDASNAGEFNGLITTATADASVLDVASPAAGGVTADNVIAELGKVVDTIPTTIYNKQDLTIYIAPNVARAYMRALGGFGANGLGAQGYNNQGTVGSKPLNFEGIDLFVANGMNSSYMLAAQKANLWFGTGLMSDYNLVKLLDMADLDGSENVRVVMHFTADSNYGISAEVVLYTPV